MLGSDFLFSGQRGFYPYQIEQSLRLNDDDSAYLSRTPASAGNRKTWTWSGWVKRGNLVSNYLFATYGSADDATFFRIAFGILGGNELAVTAFNVATFTLRTTAEFRDPSAWYHIVFALDTTQATASDRAKLYVNGVQQTVFATANYPALNADFGINRAAEHNIGRIPVTTPLHFDGYMAEVNFIDGTALDPTSFGEFKSGVWIPKKYTGSYGTNGFYLSFADSAAIGDDLSGNGNDWTPSGLASTDVLLDSPTNNYATWNPLDRTQTDNTFSDGNLRVVTGTSGFGYAKPTIELPQTGKWYAEFTLEAASVEAQVGLSSTLGTNDYVYRSVGSIFNGGTSLQTGLATYAATDLISVAYDADAGELQFYKNNVAVGTAVTIPVGNWVFTVKDANSGASVTWLANFGQSPFAYTPPAGFLALNTANLPEPTITPARDDVPADYFNTVLYTGTGASLGVTGVGFQPDLTWIKGRSGATDHGLYDGVRGVQLQLESNTTAAETTETTGLTAFGTDGFTVGALAQLNTSSATYVAWNWKANGAPVANTDGTISSTVSANQKAGFSIVSWTGTSSASDTTGHGLGVVPDMVILKSRTAARPWPVLMPTILGTGSTDYLYLNSTIAEGGDGSFGTGTLEFTSTTFRNTYAASDSGYFGGTGQDMIAYCFAEVEGYSKFGSYTGNGSADGPFCWNGFKPAFIMVKRTDTTSNWTILDDAREGYNVDNDPLYPNLSNAEGTTDLADLLSNGFKLRTTDASVNASGGTYIFAAFAEQPFKYSGGR